MNLIKCIIIEDEPLAAEILEDYISELPQLQLLGTFSDALFGLAFLRQNEVDLIFLDLHLPKLKGFDFLKSLNNPPKIIVTTAYHQYAIEGYELDVIDYLLKPIEFSRLLQAINKLDSKISFKGNDVENKPTKQKHLFFNVNKKRVKVYLDEIQYIESLKEYVKIHLSSSTITTKFQIGEIEKLLTDIELIRIHRSYLVAKSKITAYSTNIVEVNGKELPIGRSYKKIVDSLIP
jgi:two-component system, LytTR family, response regulator